MIEYNDLTVFVISTGEPSINDCIQRLKNQDCKFIIKRINNVAPMYMAFQSMLDQCQTAFYIQVDADMLLEPHAICTLRECMKLQPENVVEYVEWLWGDAEERPIQGIKIYRHSITQQFPYKDSFSCEMPQVDALRKAGYKIAVAPEPTTIHQCVGLHYSLQTPELAFRRWQRLMQKHRRYKWMGWLSVYPKRLQEKWLAKPTDINQAAYLGAISGLVGPLPSDNETDYREPNYDYRRVASYVGEYSNGPRELTLYLTNKCNFKCTHCLRQKVEFDSTSDVQVDHIKYILNKWPTIHGCCIAGFGEPLLHKDLINIMKMLRDKGVYIGLITNGSLLAQRADEISQLNPAYVSVSLNAASAEEHKASCGMDVWDDVLAGIKKSVLLMNTGISFIITCDNIDKLPKYLLLARELNAAFVYLHNLLPHAGIESEYFRKKVILRNSEEEKILLQSRSLPGAELVMVWPEPIDLTQTPLKCMSPFVSIGINGGGLITMCRRCIPPSLVNIHMTRQDVLNDSYFTSLRLSMTGDQPLLDQCRVCFGNWKE